MFCLFQQHGLKKAPEITKFDGNQKVFDKIGFFSKWETKGREPREPLTPGAAEQRIRISMRAGYSEHIPTKANMDMPVSSSRGTTPSTYLTLADVVILVESLSAVLQALALAQGQGTGTGRAVGGQGSLARGARIMTS